MRYLFVVIGIVALAALTEMSIVRFCMDASDAGALGFFMGGVAVAISIVNIVRD